MSPSPINIKDLAGLSEPTTKLIEAVSSGTGILYEPRRIIRKAKAEAKAAIIKAETGLDILEIEARITTRRDYLESRRQKNIDAIIGEAIKQLPETVSEEKADEDWVVHFFNHCQDVSNEEMQLIWSQLLAGEITEPGTYSLRTLQTVKLLNQEEAELFKKLYNYLLTDYYIPNIATDELLRRRGLDYAHFLELEALGLINVGRSIENHIPTGEEIILSYFNKKIVVANVSTKEKNFRFFMLTRVGYELTSLCDSEPDEDYLNLVTDSLRKQGFKVTVTTNGETPPSTQNEDNPPITEHSP